MENGYTKPIPTNLKTPSQIRALFNYQVGDKCIDHSEVRWHGQTFTDLAVEVVAVTPHLVTFERTVVNWYGGLNKYRYSYSYIDLQHINMQKVR